MNTHALVKKFGWEESKALVNAQSWTMRQIALSTTVDTKELTRLVESHELVEVHGYEQSKEIVANAPSDDHFYSWTLGDSGVRDKTVNIGELRQAIADVESCQ